MSAACCLLFVANSVEVVLDVGSTVLAPADWSGAASTRKDRTPQLSRQLSIVTGSASNCHRGTSAKMHTQQSFDCQALLELQTLIKMSKTLPATRGESQTKNDIMRTDKGWGKAHYELKATQLTSVRLEYCRWRTLTCVLVP
jgi:hypothetical protein